MTLVHYQDRVKKYCHLESKSFGAFNFIETFALKFCTNSHNLTMKWYVWRHKADVKDTEKMRT